MYDLAHTYFEQINLFNHVEFKSESHTYLIKGKEACSVTTFLESFVKPFDKEYWALVKAQSLGLTPQELISKWEYSSNLSKCKGSVFHSYIECILNKTNFTYPQQEIVYIFGHDPIQDAFHKTIPLIQKFIDDIENKMVPVASEFIVGDEEYLIGGTIDQLFYNYKSKQLEIWDWKTNKDIKLNSKYFHLSPIEHICDSDLDRYSLQLSLYKFILEKNTGLSIGNCYLTWFNESLTNYKIFKCKDYKEEIKLLLDHKKPIILS